MGNKKQERWQKFRHRVVRNIAYAVLYPYARLRYGITIEKFKEQEKRPYLILLNHQTPFDQFFVGMAFKGPVYYLATEDIFSMGWLSSLIRWAVAPIPIKKQTTDIAAVKTCIRVVREGGTLCIAPEGNRTYSGRTEYMNPSIASLAKKLNLPIALYRIEGGYGAEPRWSDCIRKGKMRGYVSQVLNPEDYATMSNDELFNEIEKGLFVDEAVADGTFTSKHRAEYLERAVYVCPFCGLSTFESHGDTVTCQTCGKSVVYGEDKTLTGVGFEFPFPFMAQWYDYQKEFINALDITQYYDTVLYRDTATVYEVLVYKKKKELYTDAAIVLYGDRLIINDEVFSFAELSAVTVLGRNKLNIYRDDRVYQLKGGKRFNALKYVHFFHRWKNVSKGDSRVKFLGL